jgi:hypothetical protein
LKTAKASLEFFYNDDWESVEYRLATTLALSFLASTTIILVASFRIPLLTTRWWLFLLEVAWMAILWKPSKWPWRRFEQRDEAWAEKAQIPHLMRIIVTKEAPELAYR